MRTLAIHAGGSARRAWGRAAALALLVCAGVARADSPLTSTDLASAYQDVAAVVEAGRTHRAAGEVLEFLLSDAPSDQKAAVVNALGWKFEGQKNGQAFAKALAGARQKPLERLGVTDITPTERMVLGYILALDDYFKLKALRPRARGLLGATPLELLDSAARELPDDFTVAMVRALVRAQKAMDKNWCQVFRESAEVLERCPAEKRNLRPAAVSSIEEYMGLYEKDCPDSAAARREQLEQLNQIYSLAQLGSQIVTGTQGGVVVWDPPGKKPVSIFPEFICSKLVIHGGAVWAGCDKHVVRWDGKAFRTYLNNRANDATYYAPMLGPRGKLWVRYGRKTFAYDPARDGFAPIQAPWKGNPYDVLCLPDGEVWWIDFLRAVHRGGATLALRSEAYPGSDPRELRLDALGRLWVMDFNNGVFRYDPAGGRFLHESGLEAKGTGVAFDLKSERLWLLNYTDGLVLKQNDRVLETVDLGDLQYMRDFILDSSGDLWVGGHNQLLRLHQGEQGFERDSFRVE